MKTSKATLQAVIVLVSFGFLTTQSSARPTFPATEAKNHIGEIATIYGKVYRVEFEAGRWEGDLNRTRYVTPIVLEIGESATNRTFSIILVDGNAPSLSDLKELEGKVIAVCGEIGTNRSGVSRMNIKSIRDVVNINSDFEALIRCQTNQSLTSVENSNTNKTITNKPGLIFTKADFAAGGTNAAATSKSLAKTSVAQFNPPPAHSLFPIDREMTNTITTISGAVYRNAKVTRFEPDGLTISFNGGFGGRKIPFEDLSLEYQKNYGYDAQKSAAYSEAKAQEAIKAQTQKEKEEAHQRLAAIQAQREQDQLIYEQAKAAYEQEKENYDRRIKLQTLDAQERAAYAQALQAKQAAMQTELMRRDAIIQQQKLLEMENQTYQQERAADALKGIYWQNQFR